jgi:hypothetical protein
MMKRLARQATRHNQREAEKKEIGTAGESEEGPGYMRRTEGKSSPDDTIHTQDTTQRKKQRRRQRQRQKRDLLLDYAQSRDMSCATIWQLFWFGLVINQSCKEGREAWRQAGSDGRKKDQHNQGQKGEWVARNKRDRPAGSGT